MAGWIEVEIFAEPTKLAFDIEPVGPGGGTMAERETITLAHRFGAWAASFWQRWRALEKRQLGARADGGRLFVRCAFRLGDLLIVGGLLLISGWVVLPVLLMAGFIYLITRILTIDPWPESPAYDQVDHPDHRNHWPERYDEWGDLK